MTGEEDVEDTLKEPGVDGGGWSVDVMDVLSLYGRKLHKVQKSNGAPFVLLSEGVSLCNI